MADCRYRKTPAERIAGRHVVDVLTGCWLWQGNTTREGYGQGRHWIGDSRSCITAHKASYLAHIGDVPIGLVVMHTCDTPLCINPHHLRLGTQLENIQDMFDKGRWKPRGKSKKQNTTQATS